ncbi:rhodanese-like domain-containing protein [Kitasatospora terrestris]|uniref:Rhodanese-like domain-containing protein n=1 Tax=Kitasatospora terrestris TaxID=258051 RepID=A0ABP9DH73_9ACTN
MSRSGPPTGPGGITPAEAHRLAQGGHALLLDVREPEEYAREHAPGALLLPLGQLTPRTRLPRRRTVLAICRSGNRSLVAAGLLAAHGIDVLDVTGGMRAWRQAGLPTHSGTGCPCGPAT